MKYDYHLIIIGAGSAGLVVASGAATLGAKVALIEAEKMGGDCLNYGCVPSKSFLKCAHLAKEIDNSNKFGLDATINQVKLEKVMDRVMSIIKKIEPHDSKERFEGLGVDVFNGTGSFVDKHTINVNNITITAKNIVIATGSDPVVPPIEGLDRIDYLTNKNIFDLKKLPDHLIVLGAGPIGLELGQGFRNLGSKVTVIDRNPHLFNKDDPEVGLVMEKVLRQDGVEFHLEAKIVKIEKSNDQTIVFIEKDGETIEVIGEKVLVSLGRQPVTKGLSLENANIKTNKRGYIETDTKLRTSTKNIYACGDIAGPYQFTHMAGYQAGIVIRNTIFGLGSKVDYSAVPWTTYTNPEVAHIGYTEPWAKSLGLFKESIIVNLTENDRALAEEDIDGFAKLIIGKKSRIIGATIVGNKAGEMIPVVSLAIKQKLTYSAFSSIIYSYPTETEILMNTSLKKMRDSLTPFKKKLVKRLFLS